MEYFYEFLLYTIKNTLHSKLKEYKNRIFPEASVKNETFVSMILFYNVNGFLYSILILSICSSRY
ncbi:hypothetical protein F9B13_14590 [Bacillus subtilis]|nr:hypothetical protein DQ231_06345 [Bacillus spizizenii]QAT57106.1 hypothetical protein EQW70_06910 [Bacillus subtilis]QFP72640.1 hypothetical protein F9B13_14590 [Bacillus subtilis]QFY84212.1 hypothetical protein D0819_01800 [Bacillus subtilis]UQZ57897.1 hypothetical protein C2H93_04745 [Bacillus subtilis]